MKILAVGRSYDLSDAPYDGFVIRRRLLLDVLARHADIDVVTLRPPGDQSVFNADLPVAHLKDIPVDRRVDSRQARLRSIARPDAAQEWEAELLAVIAESRPSAALTFGPWLDVEYRTVFATVPTLHVHEEDLRTMVENAPQSLPARVLRRLEDVGRRHHTPVPRHVTVIAEHEVRRARRRFGSRPSISVIPQTLDPLVFPPTTGRSSGDYLFCVGALNQWRQAEGLAQFLGELAKAAPETPVVLLSGGGIHTSVADVARSLPNVRIANDEHPVRDLYRAAKVALVPSLRSTGVKATVLQSWAMGCPVAAFSGSARSLGHPEAVIHAADAEGLVKALLRVWDDAPTLDILADAGLEIAAREFDHDTWMNSWARLVLSLEQRS